MDDAHWEQFTRSMRAMAERNFRSIWDSFTPGWMAMYPLRPEERERRDRLLEAQEKFYSDSILSAWEAHKKWLDEQGRTYEEPNEVTRLKQKGA